MGIRTRFLPPSRLPNGMKHTLREFDRRKPVTEPSVFTDNSARPSPARFPGRIIYVGGVTKEPQYSDGTAWRSLLAGSTSFATPAITYGTTAAAGSGNKVVRHNSQLLFPTALRSSANNSTLTLTDDATNQTLTGSLGSLLIVPTSHIIMTNDIGLTKFVGIGAGVLANSKFSINISSSTNNSSGINTSMGCGASSITVTSFKTDIQTSTTSGVGNASTLLGSDANIIIRGVAKTSAGTSFRARLNFSSDDATTAASTYTGLNVLTPVRATAATVTNFYGVKTETLPTWVTNGWGALYSERVEIQSASARATTALLLRQLATGATAGAHVNFDDKAGNPPAPTTGDLWRNGNSLNFRQAAATVDLTAAAAAAATDWPIHLAMMGA